MIEDYSSRIKSILSGKIDNFLREAGSELLAETQRNTKVGRVGGGKTKASWTLSPILEGEDGKSIIVGSSSENALWEEFGTGDYAVNGDGRKGGWYILIGEGKNMISEEVVKAYNFKVVYGKNGKKYAFTRGKRPKRTLENSYNKLSPKIKNMARERLKI